jgi:hypothetical protein
MKGGATVMNGDPLILRSYNHIGLLQIMDFIIVFHIFLISLLTHLLRPRL